MISCGMNIIMIFGYIYICRYVLIFVHSLHHHSIQAGSRSFFNFMSFRSSTTGSTGPQIVCNLPETRKVQK